MMFRIVILLIALLMLAHCGPVGTTPEAAPTTVTLPTQAKATSIPGATASATDTASPTNTLTATSTLTDVPTATATEADVPTSTVVSLSSRLEAEYAQIAGIEELLIVDVRAGNDGGYLVYAEIIVSPGFKTTDLADGLRQKAYAITGSAQVEFSAILDDGSPTDYNWDNGTDSWRITELNFPSARGSQ